jgi:hypothetical protein
MEQAQTPRSFHRKYGGSAYDSFSALEFHTAWSGTHDPFTESDAADREPRSDLIGNGLHPSSRQRSIT